MNEAVLKAFETFKPRARDAWMMDDAQYRERLERQIVLFPCYALPTSKAATCLSGLVHDMGVGELWMLTGEGFERDTRTILKLSRRLIAYLYGALKLRRLQMYIAVGDREGQIWAKHTGFRFEAGPLKRLGRRGDDLEIWIYEPELKGEKR